MHSGTKYKNRFIMERVSAKLFENLSSFPKDDSLTTFLTDNTSPVTVYPTYVSSSRKKIIILNPKFDKIKEVEFDGTIRHISSFETKFIVTTYDHVYLYQLFVDTTKINVNDANNNENDMYLIRNLCILDEIGCNKCIFFDNSNGVCLTKDRKITLYNVKDIINRYVSQLDEKENELNNKKFKSNKNQIDNIVNEIMGDVSVTKDDNKLCFSHKQATRVVIFYCFVCKIIYYFIFLSFFFFFLSFVFRIFLFLL